MSQQNNFIAQRFLEQNLSVNPVEDGNTPEGTIDQGSIATSEINNSDYIGAYEGLVTAFSSDIQKTGNNKFFNITVAYEVDDYRKGWFGNNLIKEGDPFVLEATSYVTPFNPIKGYIVNITNVREKIASAGVYEIFYDLYCSLTDGDFGDLDPTTSLFSVPGWVLDGYSVVGQKFRTDRRLYSYKNEVSPIPRDASYDSNSNLFIFYWDDPTYNAIGYRLRIRNTDLTYDNYFKVTGNNPNFNGELTPILSVTNPDEIGAVKITNPGSDNSLYEFSPTFLYSGVTGSTQPSMNVQIDGYSKVEITEWEILAINSINTSTGNFTVRLKKDKPRMALTTSSNNFYVDFGMKEVEDAYSYALTNVLGNNTYRFNIQFVTPIDSQVVANPDFFFLKKTIKIHTGIDLQNPGAGLTKPPKIVYDKYPTNSKYADTISLTSDTYYWSVASVYDYDQKTYSEWSQEQLISV